ncbi:MAG: heme NO-binding domain-containing protein [Armatimonadetes bacterium]|nr:heme NO-binding domain-containing protein [Armatimonadota bacterium]
MHGIVLVELRRFVDQKFGGDTWKKLQQESGVGSKMYMAMDSYPDQEAIALVTTASRMTGKPVASLLEDFGEHLVPRFIGIYPMLIKPQWKTLDFLEHVEETIHKIVRRDNPGANPPQLTCTRVSPNEVVIAYNSSRKMCGLAKGMVKGVARHYGEEVALEEPTCMLRGGAQCKIFVKTAG